MNKIFDFEIIRDISKIPGKNVSETKIVEERNDTDRFNKEREHVSRPISSTVPHPIMRPSPLICILDFCIVLPPSFVNEP